MENQARKSLSLFWYSLSLACTHSQTNGEPTRRFSPLGMEVQTETFGERSNCGVQELLNSGIT